MNYIIGVDLGGTNVKAGATSIGGTILREINIPSQAEVSPGGLLLARSLMLSRQSKMNTRRITYWESGLAHRGWLTLMVVQ